MSKAENDAIDAGTHEWDEDDFGHPYLARKAAPSPALPAAPERDIVKCPRCLQLLSVAAPSPALTREALLDAANEVAEASGELIHWDVDQQWWELPKGPVPYLDAILAALGTPPPAPTSTREETP